MTKFSDTFTQGGQTQLHKLHMIRQVVGSTLKGGLILFVLIFGLFVWFNHCWQDFWLLICFAKAWIRVEYLSLLPSHFFDESWLVDAHGVVHTVSDFHLYQSDFYKNLVRGISLSFLKKCVYSVFLSLIGFFALSWFWVRMGKEKQKTKILSGFECVEPKILRKKVLKFGASPYTIANIPIPKNAEYQHMMVTGTTGAGKSNMIHQLLEQIRRHGDQAIILDTTGGIFSRFYDECTDILLNPLDQRSHNWDMWGDVTDNYLVCEMAEAIIPESKSLDSFWVQGARQLFIECITYLKKVNCSSYKTLMHMAIKMDLRVLHEKLKDTRVSSLLDPSIDKTALSIRASLANNLDIFECLGDEKDGISLLPFMQKNTKDWLFLSCQTNQRAFLKSIFSVWLSLIIKGIMSRSEHNDSRTWIIIDELASLNKLPSLMTGLSEIRKYGGCMVLGFQDLSQIEEIYGFSQAKTLSNLTGTKVLFRAVDTDVANRIARYMGEQEKEELSTSISYGAHQMRDGVSLNQQRHVKSVVRASDIMLLQDLEAYIKYPGQFPISKVKFEYLSLSRNNDSFIPHIDKKLEEDHTEEMPESESAEVNEADQNVSNVIHPNFKKTNKEQISPNKKDEELTFDL